MNFPKIGDQFRNLGNGLIATVTKAENDEIELTHAKGTAVFDGSSWVESLAAGYFEPVPTALPKVGDQFRARETRKICTVMNVRTDDGKTLVTMQSEGGNLFEVVWHSSLLLGRFQPASATTTNRIDPNGVNHPLHYNSHPSGIEAIDVCEQLPFNVGNALKYVLRAGLKDGADPQKDLKKALWYLRRQCNKEGYNAHRSVNHWRGRVPSATTQALQLIARAEKDQLKQDVIMCIYRAAIFNDNADLKPAIDVLEFELSPPMQDEGDAG